MLNNLIRRLGKGEAVEPPAPPPPAPRRVSPPYEKISDWPEINLAGMDILNTAPAALTPAERLTLYTLAFSLRPARYMEIGTLHGGSALIINAAMDATGTDGRIFCVDPAPQIAPENRAILDTRATVFEGLSPEILPQVKEAAGGGFELVFIDGDHTYQGVLTDARAVLSVLAEPRAYLVFHDAFFPEIQRALDDFAAENEARVIDFGIVTREVSFTHEDPNNPTMWAGLRLMQVLPAA